VSGAIHLLGLNPFSFESNASYSCFSQNSRDLEKIQLAYSSNHLLKKIIK